MNVKGPVNESRSTFFSEPRDWLSACFVSASAGVRKLQPFTSPSLAVFFRKEAVNILMIPWVPCLFFRGNKSDTLFPFAFPGGNASMKCGP